MYESHIEDDCLIGADADLLDYLNATVSVHERLLTIKRSAPNKPLQKAVQLKCDMVHSPSKGRFKAGRVYYEVRAGKAIYLAPLADASFESTIEADTEFPQLCRDLLDLSLSDETNELAQNSSSSSTDKQEKTTVSPGNSQIQCDQQNVQCQTTNVESTGSAAKSKSKGIRKKSASSASSLNPSVSPEDNLNQLNLLKLGLITHPLAYDPCPKPARLHPQVLTRSGVVPCATQSKSHF